MFLNMFQLVYTKESSNSLEKKKKKRCSALGRNTEKCCMKTLAVSRAWWCTPVIPVLWSRPEDKAFIFSCVPRPRAAWEYMASCHRKPKKKKTLTNS